MIPSPFARLKQVALSQDLADPLASFRVRFAYPKLHDSNSIYFPGNSLGLMPLAARDSLTQERDTWSQ